MEMKHKVMPTIGKFVASMLIAGLPISLYAEALTLPDDVQLQFHSGAVVEEATTCPAAKQLYKEGGLWKGPKGWRYDKPSHVSEIKNFVAAYWLGVGIGPVYCIYEGVEELTFKVPLTSQVLAKKPNAGKWKKDRANPESRVCVSNDVAACPFDILIPSHESVDVESLIKLKNP
jgi:hypothetical protein